MELDVAHAVGSSSLRFLLEGLPLDCAVRGCGWRWLDLILGGHIAPQELALLVVVVEDAEPQRLVLLGVDALVLLLGTLVVAFLELGQKRVGLIEGDGFAHRLVLVNVCHVAGSEMHVGLDAQLDEECSMMVYLSQRRCRRSVDSSGSALRMKKWKDAGSS